jgi:hypothetical protein
VQKSFVEKAAGAVEEIAQKTETPLENFALVEGDITQGKSRNLRKYFWKSSFAKQPTFTI